MEQIIMSFFAPDGTGRTRFVALCQQLLALAVILAVFTPAARTVTMEVRPIPAGGAEVSVTGGAVLRSAQTATVPTTVVDPVVEEYPLTAPQGARLAAGTIRARITNRGKAGQRIVTDALPVSGYGAVGVTWAHGTALADDAIGLTARTREHGKWSGWTSIEYHDDHGPDPDTREGRRARPGTDPLLIGDVQRVQVRIDTKRAAPADMKLAVIDPGDATSSARQVPAIDTAALDGTGEGLDADATEATAAYRAETSDGTSDELALATAVTTSKPQIFSRAQWGADESMRDKSSLHYYEVHAGFVHHTVNANNYTRAQVPAILRGIYAYHTRSRGWSDIGYNFLVDRFGRVWEGRYGGVDRPVVGAHTLGYNDDAFAASAIGNYETAKPSKVMLRAYARLFAWKLSLHGVDASSTRQYVTSKWFQAIIGHRDAGSTACPGKYLYAKIPKIRRLAARTQQGWSGRELESDLTGDGYPDLILRRASDGEGIVVPLRRAGDGSLGKRKAIDSGIDLSAASTIFKAGDWDRDGKVDLLVRRKGEAAKLYLYRGNGDGTFVTTPTLLTSGLRKVRLLAAVGDMTGDGYPDLMGQRKGGSMMIYPGKGTAGLKTPYVAHASVAGGRQIGIGRWDGDGSPDSVVRRGDALTVWYGNGPGGWTGSRQLSTKVGGYDWMVGISSLDGDAHGDMVVRTKATGKVWFVPGSSGGFGKRVLLATLKKFDRAA